ncbi:hypothetical protein WA026_000489 [Henosepilachna vigintioctopunctata]|uniref:Uncharacterized protein n=1 Tax=Henosepilachna vigintioctopunctata TaxID=420089 RepID=A0AAW1UXS9_9CUCU
MCTTNNLTLGCFLLTLAMFMVVMEASPSKKIDESTDEFAPVIIENARFVGYNNLSHLDSNLYEDVIRVSFESNNLTHTPIRFLGDLHNLIELTLKNNIIENFDIKSLDHYFATKLQKLTVRNQNIGPLLNNSFIRMRNLTYLALICTFPSRIEKSTFNGLTKLDELDLSGNNITVIDKELLQPLKKLRILILNNNNFKKFSIIPVLNNLETIYLENNPIERAASINRTALRLKAPKLRHIKFCTQVSISCQNFENICVS